MTRKEFYQNLYNKGVADPTIAKQYEQKWISSGRSFDEQPTQAPEQQGRSWYDVPGKIANTWQGVNSSIQREAELTAQGRQNPVAGGALSIAHVAGGVGNTIGNVIEPVVNNPFTRNLAQMVAGGIQSAPSNRQSIPWSGRVVNTPNQDKLETLQNIVAQNSELGNRLNAAMGLTNLLGVKIGGGAVLKKAERPIEDAASKIAKVYKESPLASERGSVEIPDIHEEARKIESMGDLGTPGNPILSAKGVKKVAGEAPKLNPIEKLSGIDEREATVLQLPTEKGDVPFTDYAIQAIRGKRGADPKTGAPVQSAMDLVGKRGVEAEKKIVNMRREIGEKKDDLLKTIDDAVVNNNSFIQNQSLKDVFKRELEDKLGAYIAEDGSIKAAARGIRNEGLVPEARSVLAMIERTPNEMTAEQLDALSANLRSFLSKRKASELKPQSDQLDIVVNSVRDQINKELEIKASELLSPKDFQNYIKAKRDYANIKNIEDELSKGLGREVVPGSEVASRGASIMKRMVQSNADAGSKALSQAVKQLTGIDLFKEANYAEIAMRAVGDPRAESLLAQGMQNTLAKGPRSALTEAGLKKAQKTITGEKINRLIDYYNKKQAAPKPSGSALTNLKNKLRDERGSIGAENPQIHSDNFKQWFGDWNKDPANASKVVDEQGKPLVVYHGTNSNFNEFKPSSGMGNQGGNDQIKGIYFTDNKEGASFFANNERYIKNAFVSIKNPLIVENKKILKEKLGIEKLSEAEEKIKKLGYDGVIINKGMYANGGPHKEIIAFSPNQIKSATGNSGAFSKLTNDIRGNTGVKMLAGMSGAGVGGLTLAGMIKAKNRNRK